MTLTCLRRSALLVVFALTCLFSCQMKADPPELLVGEHGESIAAAVRSAEAHGFSGAVLAARKGEVVAALGVGFADLKRGRRNTATTLFEIASATKQFTAAAILVLQQNNKLELDDSITNYLPNVPDHCRKLTLRHLLQHTTGIRGERTAGGSDDLSKSVAAFLSKAPEHEPGTQFSYWNPGYALLAGVVEEASDNSYMHFCTEHLFRPAGMQRSCFTGDKAPDGVDVAVGTEGDRTRSALEHPLLRLSVPRHGRCRMQCLGLVAVGSRPRWRQGAESRQQETAVHAWPRGLRARVGREDECLQADSPLPSRLAPQPNQVSTACMLAAKSATHRDGSRSAVFLGGLGPVAWPQSREVLRYANNCRTSPHGGDVDCFHMEMRRYPDEDGFIVVLTNNGAKLHREIADRVEALLFERPTPMLPATLRAQLAGEYQADSGIRLDFIAGPVMRTELVGTSGATSYGSLVGSTLDDLQIQDTGTGKLYPVKCKMENDRVVELELLDKRFRRP